jgi:hypothetical protein
MQTNQQPEADPFDSQHDLMAAAGKFYLSSALNNHGYRGSQIARGDYGIVADYALPQVGEKRAVSLLDGRLLFIRDLCSNQYRCFYRINQHHEKTHFPTLADIADMGTDSLYRDFDATAFLELDTTKVIGFLKGQIPEGILKNALADLNLAYTARRLDLLETGDHLGAAKPSGSVDEPLLIMNCLQVDDRNKIAEELHGEIKNLTATPHPAIHICYPGCDWEAGDVVNCGHILLFRRSTQQGALAVKFLEQTRNEAERLLGYSSNNIALHAHSMGCPAGLIAKAHLLNEGIHAPLVCQEPFGLEPTAQYLVGTYNTYNNRFKPFVSDNEPYTKAPVDEEALRKDVIAVLADPSSIITFRITKVFAEQVFEVSLDVDHPLLSSLINHHVATIAKSLSQMTKSGTLQTGLVRASHKERGLQTHTGSVVTARA